VVIALDGLAVMAGIQHAFNLNTFLYSGLLPTTLVVQVEYLVRCVCVCVCVCVSACVSVSVRVDSNFKRMTLDLDI